MPDIETRVSGQGGPALSRHHQRIVGLANERVVEEVVADPTVDTPAHRDVVADPGGGGPVVSERVRAIEERVLNATLRKQTEKLMDLAAAERAGASNASQPAMSPGAKVAAVAVVAGIAAAAWTFWK